MPIKHGFQPNRRGISDVAPPGPGTQMGGEQYLDAWNGVACGARGRHGLQNKRKQKSRPPADSFMDAQGQPAEAGGARHQISWQHKSRQAMRLQDPKLISLQTAEASPGPAVWEASQVFVLKLVHVSSGHVSLLVIWTGSAKEECVDSNQAGRRTNAGCHGSEATHMQTHRNRHEPPGQHRGLRITST